jgi:glycosyltransferase involved in cell wall biosynthesis
MLAGNLDLIGAGVLQAALTAGLPVLHAVANALPGYGETVQPRSPDYWMAPCSDWNGRALREAGYAPARMETVYPGARMDRFFRLFLPETAPLRICYASIVLPYKGPHVLVQALVRLRRRKIPFTAEIAGEAPDPEFLADLRDAVEAAGLEQQVRFPGFLDRAGLAAMFGRSNVLVFPSKFAEPFGISQVEAMAAGLVVVTSGTGGAGEIVRHETNGLVFNPDRPDDLAGQLGRLARDPALAARLQRAGQARAAELSTSQAVRRIEELVEEQIASRP